MKKKDEELDMNKEIVITCKKHTHFLMTPRNHLDGSGCPVCDNIVSEASFKKMKEEMKYKDKFELILAICEDCREYHLYYLVKDKHGNCTKMNTWGC
jgi:hypothetical protein